MGDNTSSSDSDNILIPSPTNGLRRTGCNAATQTPELPRRNIVPSSTDAKNDSIEVPSVVVLRIGDNGQMSNFEQEARAMAIPDVVVEYIKDNVNAKTDNYGKENSAFENDEVMIRIPSRASFREDSRSNASSLNLQLPASSDRSIGSEDGLLPIGTQNPRLYYSMPRKGHHKRPQTDIQLHSQPSTPKLQRLKISNQIGTSASLLSLLQQNGGNFVVPPSPTFGYSPLESETSAVYTIFKTCMNTNTLKEVHFLSALSDSAENTPRITRKFEYTPPPPNIERFRRRLQIFTDFWSVLFLVLGVFLAVFTPVLIVPMMIYPIEYFIEYISYFVAAGALSAVMLAFSCFIGNIVWHYNENTQKLRPKLHCGRGPRLHFWADSFNCSSGEAKAKTEKEIIV